MFLLSSQALLSPLLQSGLKYFLSISADQKNVSPLEHAQCQLCLFEIRLFPLLSLGWLSQDHSSLYRALDLASIHEGPKLFQAYQRVPSYLELQSLYQTQAIHLEFSEPDHHCQQYQRQHLQLLLLFQLLQKQQRELSFLSHWEGQQLRE